MGLVAVKKLRILVDMDEVLNNLLDGWVEYLNKRHGLRAEARDIKVWDVGCVYPALTEEEVNQPLYDNGFWESLVPKPHAVAGLEEMLGDGHEIFIVTASSVYQTLPAKIGWLLKHYPFLTWDDVIIARRKQMVSGDVLIDDGIHNLEGGGYFKILMDCPNNRGYDAAANGMVKVFTLREAYGAIKKEFGEDV
jgi:5'(3')-deoxyribonucleotidase